MKKQFASVAVVLLLMVLSACNGDSSSPTEPTGSRGQTLTLRVGETVRLDGGDEVTLVRVVADSRCPITALCPQLGFVEAEVQVRQASAGTSSGLVRLEVGQERQESTAIGRYAFQMGRLVKPAKTDSGPVPQSAYEINLIAFAR